MFLKFLPRIASILVLFFGFLNLSAQTIDTSELNEWVKQARKSQHNYDFKQSTYWFRKAVKAYKEIGGVCQTFSMENQIAYNYLDQEQGPEAIHLIDSLVKSFTTQSDCQDTLTKISLLMTQHIIYRDLNRADASKRPLDEARELAIQMNDSVWLAKIYNNYTAYYGQRGANYLALEYASRSMELKRRVMDRDDPSFRRGLFTMANYAERIGQYETAYLYLDSIISLYHGQEMGDLADTYHLLSLICCRKKDYEIARKYAELALDEFIKQSGPSSRSASFGYQEVGMALTGLEKYREALPNFEKAYAIRREIFGKDDRLTLSSLSQLVKTQIQLGDTLNSIDRFKEVVQAFTRKYDISEAPKYALNLLDLGTLYAEAGLLDSALIYFYRVQQIAESYYPVRDRIHSQTHLQLARYGPLQTRDHHIHQALFSLLGDSSLYALNRRTLAFASDKYAVLQAFYIHAQNLYELFQNTKNFQYLKDLLTLEPQFSMIKNEIFNQFLASKSVIESAPIIREIGLLRLRSAWVLYQQNHEEAYLDLALRAMEESKNILLQTQLFEKNLKNLLHLPDSLVQRERELYFEINNLDYVLKENPSDSLREHKLDLERKYFDLRRNLLFQSSRLQAITNDNLITLEGTQKKLSSKTLVVDYFLNQGELFILAIGKHYAHFEKYPFDSLSQQSLSDFVTLLQKLPGEDGASDFRQLAFENYSTLLPFEIQKSTKELVIIPDNDLYIIPFDALIDEKPSASMAIADLAFLVKKYQISYLAGLNISRSTVSGLDTKAVAFAPFVPGVDENLVQVPLLRYTDSELQVIDDNFELEAFRGKDATEERFKHMVGQHSLLHIASHAIIDNEYPLQSNILFYPSGDKDDGKLQLWELYGLEIPAKLAVLSACKTADGALMKGAGIMNISRGFSVSGTDQVLSNLWPAQDFAASEVIGSFYRELKHDHDPAKALRQAKLNYLTQQNGPLLYPAYWAGWIIQYSELEEAASFTVTTYHWILICSISLLLIWFGFHRYAQRQEKK